MTQDVDPQTFYDVGKGLFEKAGTLYTAFKADVATLGETGSMAGSTDDGAAWAQSYDGRVADVLGAVNDLTKALENYGGVIIQAGYNHAMAEYNANPAKTGPPPQRPAEPASVAGELTAPPSAGGPGTGLVENIGVLEHIGIPVPDGNTDKLDKASKAWNQLATAPGTTAVVQALGANAGKFRDTKSPEVDYIVKDLDELHQSTDAILGSCTELAQSCSEYKAALDELRTNMKETIEDLVEELAISALVGIAAAFLSAGAGAFAATAKALASINKYAKIIRGAIETWKISKNINKGVKKIHDVASIRKRLERIKNLGRKAKPAGPQLGPGVQTTGGRALTTTRTQIEKKFKHATDFGVTEPRGKGGFDQFEHAIKSHMDNPSTIHINGTYRGDPAIINYDPNTGLAVIQKPTGEFISGWRLDPQQTANVLQRGSLR